MYSKKMFQSNKRGVLEVTWERCCDLAWKASRRSLHRDHTSVLARDVQGAKATPNRAKRAPGCTSEKKMTSSIAREFPMFRNISERVEDVRVHKREKIRVHKREKIRVHKRPPCLYSIPLPHGQYWPETAFFSSVSLISTSSRLCATSSVPNNRSLLRTVRVAGSYFQGGFGIPDANHGAGRFEST